MTAILIRKSARRLVLTLADGGVLEYRVDLGRNAAADKTVEGDDATPLGEFYVCAKNPRSKYHRSLCLSYPNAEDAQRGLDTGLIGAQEHRDIMDALRRKGRPPQKTRLGGEIYIHGRSADPPPAARDWTRGCIALANDAMSEVYAAAELGTPVRIVE